MTSDKEIKKAVRIETGMKMGRGTPVRAEIRTAASFILESQLKQTGLTMDQQKKGKLLDDVCDDLLGFGPLQKFMDDNEITEIMVNGPFSVYIEKKGKKILSDEKFDSEDHLRNILEKMLGPSGRRLDESSPYVDFSLKDGSRVNAIISPLAVDGSTITIRKFLESISSIDDLIKFGTLDERMSLFLKASIRAKLNIIFSGATGSGKTTTLAVLCNDLSSDERIITIEDALELNLGKKHVVRLLTRPQNIEGKGEVTVRHLFSNTLRMRPTRIVLGEIRGEEAMDFLQAVNSGHDGTLAVLHASTPMDSVGRLETMAMYAGLNMPSSEIRRQIASGVHLILQHEQFADGSRKITAISEIRGYENGNIDIKDIFRYEISDVSETGNITGEFKVINRPEVLSRFKKRAVKFDDSMFL